MNDLRLYILMRTDLSSMGPGRSAAQASHATSAFMNSFGPDSKCQRVEVKEWMRMTKQGFGTAIILGVTKEQIESIFDKGPLKRWIMKEKVYDPDYGVHTSWEIFKLLDPKSYHRFESIDTSTSQGVRFFRKEMTCAYIFGEKEDLIESLGGLPLYTGHE